jgi:hypothetical protein
MLVLHLARAAWWIAQAQQFYTNALAQETVLAKLGEFGVTEAKRKAGQAQVVAAEAAYAAQKRDKGAAQQATQACNAALRQLTRWHSDFVRIAHIAFEDEPQCLEQLGIVAPSIALRNIAQSTHSYEHRPHVLRTVFSFAHGSRWCYHAYVRVYVLAYR